MVDFCKDEWFKSKKDGETDGEEIINPRKGSDVFFDPLSGSIFRSSILEERRRTINNCGNDDHN